LGKIAVVRRLVSQGLAASGLLLALTFASPPGAKAATRYIFSTFGGDAPAAEQLSIYTSDDGLAFTLLSNTGYAGPTGVLRDPSIMRHVDGKFYVAYTVESWTTTSTSFAIASSEDLSDWTFLTSVDAGVPGVHDTWAPEWFLDSDGSVHLIVSIDTLGTDSDFQAYLFTATDGTLTAWSGPEAMGIGPNYIDTFVVKDDGAYHAFSKNETTKYIEHAVSSSLLGPWSWVGVGDWAGWGSGEEGPALVRLDDGRWRIFMDCYNSCGFLTAVGTDLTSWSATSPLPGLSGQVRHGTVWRDEDSAIQGDGGQADGGAPDAAAVPSAGCGCMVAVRGRSARVPSALFGFPFAVWLTFRRRLQRRRGY
jgi:hypothetical protein